MAEKIFFYTHALVDGGAERLWSRLATAFAQMGDDVTFVQDFEADENRDGLAPGITIVTLGRGHISGVLKLARLLRAERPAVALGAVGASNIKLIAANCLAGFPTKVIQTFHGFEEYKSGLLSYLTYAGLPLLSRLSALTITGSDGLRTNLVQRWRSSPKRTITLHNPVFFPSTAAVPATPELASREPIILSAGRLVREKDFPTLIRAFAKVKTPGARLIILGKGPEQSTIENEIARLGLKDRVELAGYAKEPWAYYAQARCFALSSVTEQFGNVLVEALAHGLPVVATRCSGPSEVLGGGAFGTLVETGNPDALAQAIDEALATPGDPGRRRQRADTFSFATRVPQYNAIVRDVIGVTLQSDARSTN